LSAALLLSAALFPHPANMDATIAAHNTVLMTFFFI
jgi:hypothetical protein